MKINATLSISFPRGGSGESRVKILFRDEASRIPFVEAEISYEEFTAALSSLCERPCSECKVSGLQFVGKKHERKVATIIAPDLGYKSDGAYEKWLAENGGEEGWMVNTYLGSHGSKKRVEGGVQLTYSLYRYVEAAS